MRIKIEQGTPEWHELRAKKYKTASRTAVVMGLSPFQTQEQLAEELKGTFKPFFSEAMKKGIELEDEVRKWASFAFDREFEPAVFFEGQYLASLDGINGDTVVELKVSKKTYDEIQSGTIPKHYEWQAKHQLWLSGARVGYLVAYNGEDFIASGEITCTEDDIANIKKAWNDFDVFLAEYEPKSETTVTDFEAVSLSDELASLMQQKKLVEAREKEIKEALKPLATADKTIIGCITITKQKGRTSIDYKKMIEDNQIEVKPYEKNGADTFVFRVRNAKNS